MRPSPTTKGYLKVTLWRCGTKSETYVHRLVARLFCENPFHKEEVNHKDGNPGNNHFMNLEWVTSAENSLHAARELERHGNKAIIGTSIIDGAVIRFKSICEAAEHGFKRANIYKCLVGKRNHAGGYKWAIDAAMEAAK